MTYNIYLEYLFIFFLWLALYYFTNAYTTGNALQLSVIKLSIEAWIFHLKHLEWSWQSENCT